MPWEYDNRYLITLCSVCHAKVHANNPGINFVTKDKRVIKDSKVKNNKHKKYRKKWMRDVMEKIEMLNQLKR